jgi:replicative DNA helicase
VELFNAVPKKAFYGRQESSVHRMLQGYFEKFSKLPTYDVLQAAVTKQMSEERAEVINAYIDSLRSIESDADNAVLVAELTDSVVVNTIDNKIEALVEAGENRDILQIKKIIAEIMQETSFGGNKPQDAKDMEYKPENLKSVDCWMPTVQSNTSLSGVCLISGGSGGGKSVWALGQALHSYNQGLDVATYNIELPKTEFQARILSNISEIPFNDINKPDLSDNFIGELNTIWKAYFHRPNKFVIRNGRLDAEELVNRIKEEARTGLDVCLIDYIQIVDSNDIEEWRMLSKLVKTLHDLSSELGIVIITPIQINSVDTKEKNNRIHITTRGSRELEFSATCWFHIQQTPEEYEEKIARLFTVKARNGRKATYIMKTKFDTMKFIDTGATL